MYPNILSGLNSKNLVKAKTASSSFFRVWLKDGENRSQHRESWHALLVKRETSLCGFAKVGLKGDENILECLKSLHARLLIKLALKFMIKFKF